MSDGHVAVLDGLARISERHRSKTRHDRRHRRTFLPESAT
jgi:hypothetical protein